MTGREVVNRRISRGKLLVLAGVLIVILSLSGLNVQKATLFLVAVAITLTGVALAIAGQYALLTIRCPWCGGNLRSLVYRKPSIDHAKFCFHCAKSLDDALAAEPKPKGAAVLDELT
jgi:hypothetical protein